MADVVEGRTGVELGRNRGSANCPSIRCLYNYSRVYIVALAV